MLIRSVFEGDCEYVYNKLFDMDNNPIKREMNNGIFDEIIKNKSIEYRKENGRNDHTIIYEARLITLSMDNYHSILDKLNLLKSNLYNENDYKMIYEIIDTLINK